MNGASLTAAFRKKLIQWILIPGLLLTALAVTLVALSQLRIVERETRQLSRSLSKNVGFYMDGAEDVLQTIAMLTQRDKETGLEDAFEGLGRYFDRFERLIFLDSDGNIVAVAPRGIRGVDFPIHLTQSNTQRHVLTSPIISPHSGKLVVFTSIPTDAGGKIVAELSLDALQQFIYGFVSSERTIILTDAYGNLIVHPDQELVRVQYNIGSLDIFTQPPQSSEAKFYTAGETLYFGTLTHIPGTGWRLLVATKARTIFRPVVFFGVIIAFLTFCVFMMVLLALTKEFRTNVIAPMRRYSEGLAAVAEGEYPAAPAQGSEYSELAEFDKVFGRMSAKVREREQELRVSRAFFQSVIDSMPSVLIWIDEDYVVRLCNTKAREVFGERADMSRGPRPVEAFFAEQPDIVSIVRGADEEHECPCTLKRRSVNSNPLALYDVTMFPLVGGEMGGVVVRMDDVTAQVRMEEIMVQTEKMMSVGGLAAGMAHEINNPLGSILQGAQNLRRRFSPDIKANIQAAEAVGCPLETMQSYLEARKILRIVDGIAQSGKRAADIVANMLEFSRPGKSEKTAISVTQLVEASLDLATKDYDLKKNYDFLRITIVRDFAEGLPDIICSRTEIEQVLFNLLKNAAQAMADEDAPDKTPTVTIRTHKDPGGVAIEIEDNGPGLPPDIRRRIFEPFFTTKPTGIGTGLGLSVSYFIITQNHGGALSVDSSPGQWTRFTVVLPVGGGG
ncbi:ATP-binding protein [Desulfobaculum sp. SPO524]|uniref:sensor histidine kinase n=1 Tax=Desulfobaculum sp. SPO524 TaxID=3378071 RepID=UPI003855235B